jgi:DnaJ-class molecular chaperone
MKRRRLREEVLMRQAGTCPACRGTGQMPLNLPYGLRMVPCSACDGTGSCR